MDRLNDPGFPHNILRGFRVKGLYMLIEALDHEIMTLYRPLTVPFIQMMGL